jgi:hypothetical protein
MHTEFCSEKPERKRPHGRGKNCVKIGDAVMRQDAIDMTHLAPDGDQWRALVNTALNLLVS